jgi:hypothetical protein
MHTTLGTRRRFALSIGEVDQLQPERWTSRRGGPAAAGGRVREARKELETQRAQELCPDWAGSTPRGGASTAVPLALGSLPVACGAPEGWGAAPEPPRTKPRAGPKAAPSTALTPPAGLVGGACAGAALLSPRPCRGGRPLAVSRSRAEGQLVDENAPPAPPAHRARTFLGVLSLPPPLAREAGRLAGVLRPAMMGARRETK